MTAAQETEFLERVAKLLKRLARKRPAAACLIEDVVVEMIAQLEGRD